MPVNTFQSYRDLSSLRRGQRVFLKDTTKDLIRVIFSNDYHLLRVDKKLRNKNVKMLIGSGGIRTHASEETGALNQRLRIQILTLYKCNMVVCLLVLKRQDENI